MSSKKLSNDHDHMMHGHEDHHVDDHSHQSHAADHMDYKQKKAARQKQARHKVTFGDSHADVLHLFDQDHGPESIMHNTASNTSS